MKAKDEDILALAIIIGLFAVFVIVVITGYARVRAEHQANRERYEADRVRYAHLGHQLPAYEELANCAAPRGKKGIE